jgi:hypothetical protein
MNRLKEPRSVFKESGPGTNFEATKYGKSGKFPNWENLS